MSAPSSINLRESAKSADRPLKIYPQIPQIFADRKVVSNSIRNTVRSNLEKMCRTLASACHKRRGRLCLARIRLCAARQSSRFELALHPRHAEHDGGRSLSTSSATVAVSKSTPLKSGSFATVSLISYSLSFVIIFSLTAISSCK